MAAERPTSPAPATLDALLASASQHHAKRTALIERGGETLTFSELSIAAAVLAAELRDRGIARGDVVGVWLPNWVEIVVWEFALASLGAAMLGINTRYGVDELTHLLERGRPVGIVVPARFLDLDFAGRLRQAADTSAAGRRPWVAIVRATDGDDPSRFDIGGATWRPTPPREAVARRGGIAQPDPIPNAAHATDPVNYFTTSGSTGLPKLAGHDQRSVALHSAAVAEALEMRPGDRFLGVLPLTGVFGFNPAMAMLSAGGACLLEPVFDPELVVSDMEAHGVTHAIGGDDMLGRLMDAWRAAEPVTRPALRSLRRGAVADFAGRVGAVVEWGENDLGVAFSGVYGSSELFALTSMWPPELHRDDRMRAGGIVVSSDIEVRVGAPNPAAEADPEAVRVCPPNTTGELQFRGYNVVTGYLGDPDAGRNAYTDDGWFRSGDLGFVLEQPGSFVYICRAGDALRLRGFLVEPAEIERFLCSHPQVVAAKVVGARSHGGGDVAVAYVQRIAGATVTEEELRAFCRERLARFKVPAYLNLIDAFPVTAGTNGTKIRTAELRRWAEDQVAASSGR